MQTKLVRFHQPGGPEVLKLETADVGSPGPGEALVRHVAIGLNYMDVYHRSGAYPLPLPSPCGGEAAGIVEAVGSGVSEVATGDRVVYAGGAPGAYAERRLFPAARLVRIPDGVSDEVAAAVLLKGMTVEYLLQRCVQPAPGSLALMYAAAGGVGLLAGQWARDRGVKLIGVVSGADKAALAREAGYFAVIDRSREDVVARVKEISGGAGVPIVYDSVGKATFDTSLKCLSPRGYFVSFGTTTGAPPPVEAATLQKLGSLYFTRPTLVTYTASREELVASAGAVFDRVKKGVLKPHIGKRYALADIVQAHADLEGGRTAGSSIVVP